MKTAKEAPALYIDPDRPSRRTFDAGVVLRLAPTSRDVHTLVVFKSALDPVTPAERAAWLDRRSALEVAVRFQRHGAVGYAGCYCHASDPGKPAPFCVQDDERVTGRPLRMRLVDAQAGTLIAERVFRLPGPTVHRLSQAADHSCLSRYTPELEQALIENLKRRFPDLPALFLAAHARRAVSVAAPA